ncbi:MAG: radical SAM protein [Thermodesulfobacteriota bacterium]|nr:radical SAM protein [Thermodesulfobacteriota bacterium]
MANGLLINYAGVPHEMSSLFPDNGLAVLAAVLKGHNHSVQILDFSTIDTIAAVYSDSIRRSLAALAPTVYGGDEPGAAELEQLKAVESDIQAREIAFLEDQAQWLSRRIEQENITWIGFKLWMGSVRQSMMLAAALKKAHPGLKIFGGGPCVDIFQEAILEKYPFIDALVFAEAEVALPMLVDWAGGQGRRSGIPNLIFSKDGRIIKNEIKRIRALDDLPMPLYGPDVYPAMAGDEKMKILCFDDSRGCPMGCAFCPGVNKFGVERIEKSANRCIAELAHLKQRYGTRFFRFSGSNTSGKLLNAVAEKLIAEKMDIVFAVFSSAGNMKAKAIETLARAGLFSVFMGIESADTDQLHSWFGKKQSLSHMAGIIQACKQAGVFVSTSIIYPGPFSDDRVFRENLDYLTDLLAGYPHCSVAIYPAGLYPHTKWYDNPEAYGFRIQSPSKAAYAEEVLDYRYNIILPRYLWKSIPYTLNGKPFHQLLMETHSFAQALASRGILTYLVEANLMMAATLGYGEYTEFARQSNIAFFTGDAGTLRQWNAAFNREEARHGA